MQNDSALKPTICFPVSGKLKEATVKSGDLTLEVTPGSVTLTGPDGFKVSMANGELIAHGQISGASLIDQKGQHEWSPAGSTLVQPVKADV